MSERIVRAAARPRASNARSTGRKLRLVAQQPGVAAPSPASGPVTYSITNGADVWPRLRWPSLRLFGFRRSAARD
jgi:hypothetical protein